MKILFVVFNDYLGANGISVVTQYLAEGLVNKNHEVKVFTVAKNDLKPSEYNGVRIETFKIDYNRFKRPKGEIQRLRRCVIEEKSDVIVLVSLQTPTSDSLFNIFDDLSAKKILYTHDFSGLYLKPFKWNGDIWHSIGNSWNYIIWKKYYSSVVPKFINKFDMTVSLSALNKDWEYLNHFFSGKKVIIPNAAEDIFFTEIDEGTLIDDKYFVSVANYNHIKNQKYILSEYYKAKASNEYAMVFCGSQITKYCTELKKLKRKLDRKYGKRTVYFLCGVERNKIPGLIKNARIYLCGSRWEAFSISLIESMALGVPFVCLDVGNASELPGGVTLSQEKKFSEMIDELCMNEMLLSEYSSVGKKYASTYCRKDMAVDKFENAINELFFEELTR